MKLVQYNESLVSTVDTGVLTQEYQNDTLIITSNIAASRLHEVLR